MGSVVIRLRDSVLQVRRVINRLNRVGMLLTRLAGFCVLTSQVLIVRSLDPEMMRRPSGE